MAEMTIGVGISSLSHRGDTAFYTKTTSKKYWKR